MIRKFWLLVPLRKIIGMNRAPPLMLYPDFFFKKKDLFNHETVHISMLP